MSRPQWRWAIVLLVAGVGACVWLYPQSPQVNPAVPVSPAALETDLLRERILLALCLAAALLPATRERIFRCLTLVRRMSSAGQRASLVAILLLSGPILLMMALASGRVLLPYWHDECFYRLQTTFLAHGRLTMPQHPLADFFDVPYVFVRPLTAVAYFPGTALLHAPGVWLHLPYWAMPLGIAAVSISLLFWIVNELIDPLAAWLAVALMLSLEVFRWLAPIEMSHAAGLLWSLTAFACWLKWRKKPALRWALLAALAAGAYLITRPFDAVFVLLPIALVWSAELGRVKPRQRAQAVLGALLVICPFIALQLWFDQRVTGHLLQTPLSLYYRTLFNEHGVGPEHFDPTFVPPTASLLLRDTYRGFALYNITRFQTPGQIVRQFFQTRIPVTLGVGLPSLLLVIFIPLSLLKLGDRRWAVLVAIFLCYLGASAAVVQYLDHYVIAIVPSILLALLLGGSVLTRMFERSRGVAVFTWLAIFALAMNRIVLNHEHYQQRGRNVMRVNYLEIPRRVKLPAIVLFRYQPDEPEPGFNLEPVYNWDVASPDDAPIIRANDLGPRDRELFAYYAARQPNRTVYRFDRQNKNLVELGNVADLAATGQRGIR